MICKYCQSKNTSYTVKLVATNRQDKFYPKYIPQIKAVCADCLKYIKFAPQTPELIEKLNRQLETVAFVDRFEKKHSGDSQRDFEEWLSK